MPAFTKKHTGLTDVLITDCGLADAYIPNQMPQPAFATCTAIWDTGASKTVISRDMVQRLNLQPVGLASTMTANGLANVNIYYVAISLPNNMVFPALQVIDGELGDTDMLIGMDIIARGDFAITSGNGNTIFTFEIPATHEIDFTK